MKLPFLRRLLPQKRRWWLVATLLLAMTGLVIAILCVPELRELAVSTLNRARPAHAENDGHDHAKETPNAHGEAGDNHTGHDHSKHADGDEDERAHGGKARYDHVHDEAAAIKLSKQARGNIGLRMARVELKPFERTITVPGIIVERPGWSMLEVTAPMTGVVTKTYPIQGEAVEPGQPLFEVRLTHEDLLQVQTEFLRTIEELDVIGREVARLEKVSADGVIAGKTLLERKYEQQKQEAALRAQRQALLLHGLSQDQVDKIVASRTLLQSLTIYAPVREAAGASETHPLQVQQLKVSQGKYVTAGDTLCTLVDYGELYIQGRAFEQDIRAINRAATAAARISAVLGSKSTADEEVVEGLHILYLSDKVDSESRAFHFYIELPNRVLREDKTPGGRRFVYWQFKPGQRTQVRVPVEQWKDRIVLPVEAVAQEGAEAYVFEANDDHFDRRPVQVEYRDQDWVVIANDGALKVGAMVAASAAHQVQLALKSKAGGGVDPHAGHNH
jgi:cobalt-zinc-cadmium efflux system membrane fusion protein